MPVYSQEKYESEVKQRIKSAWRMSWASISSIQQSARDLFDATTPAGIQKTVFSAPAEDDLLVKLLLAVDAFQLEATVYDRPQNADVKAEWVFGPDVVPKVPSKNGPVLLYVHGGGFIYGSPATARRTTRRLAALTAGCCVAVQYRYATEQPFPAQHLDILVAYFSLLSSGIPSHRIVFAGESSGLNLLVSVLQVLLYLRRQASTLRFHGRDVRIDLPAAVAGVSGFFDITNGLPSWTANGRRDILPELQPTYMQAWDDQDLWPTKPARADVYCERSAMTHPLVSPVTVEDWRGAPPLFIAVGEERNMDANLYVAQTAARHGVVVRLERWELMTHVWSTGLPKLPHSQKMLEHYAAFCVDAVKGVSLTTQGWDIDFAEMAVTPFDVLNCTKLTRERVLDYVKKAQQARILVQQKGPQTRL